MSQSDTGYILTLITQSAAKYGLDPNFLTAVAQQESKLNANAVSSKGALGVMQLMPTTAKNLGVTDPLDPQQNIDAGASLLSTLLNRYNGDPALALAAYNAGPTAVTKYGGIPPFAETQNYVNTILSHLGYDPSNPPKLLSHKRKPPTIVA